jgi:transcriptional regulator with XRE-family HTH domain
MASFQISLTPAKRVAGRFAATVRRELQKALAEERKARGLTQAAVAAELGVNRSVIHRQIIGHENMTIGRVGEIAGVLGREICFSLVCPQPYGNNAVLLPTPASESQSAMHSPDYFKGRVFGNGLMPISLSAEEAQAAAKPFAAALV